MIVILRTQNLGEFIEWEMKLSMIGSPENELEYVKYKDDNSMYCIEVEENLALGANIDRVTLSFETAKDYSVALNKLEKMNIWFVVKFGDPDKDELPQLTTFLTYARAAGLNVAPDKTT